MTDRPDPSMRANSLWDLAEANPGAPDFAIRVRKAYDVITEAGTEPADARALLVFQLSLMQQRGLITKKHCTLADQLLPKPPPKKRGRPKGALGDNAYNKRYELQQHWTYEKTLNPSLTKEQFAQQRLSITDEDLEGKYGSLHRPKVDALLQELKPARMKQLDEGQRLALEKIYPLLITYPQYLARKYQEAKQHSPKLSKEGFLHRFFGWPRRKKRHPVETDIIQEYLEKLEQGEKLLADSERG